MDVSGASVGHATCTGFETAGWNATRQAAARPFRGGPSAGAAAAAGDRGRLGRAEEQQVTGAEQALETDLATLQRANSALTGSAA